MYDFHRILRPTACDRRVVRTRVSSAGRRFSPHVRVERGDASSRERVRRVRTRTGVTNAGKTRSSRRSRRVSRRRHAARAGGFVFRIFFFFPRQINTEPHAGRCCRVVFVVAVRGGTQRQASVSSETRNIPKQRPSCRVLHSRAFVRPTVFSLKN